MAAADACSLCATLDWSTQPKGPPISPGCALGAVPHSFGLSASVREMGVTMRPHCKRSGERDELEEEAAAAAGRLAGAPEAEEDSDADSDSDLEMEGALGQGWGPACLLT